MSASESPSSRSRLQVAVTDCRCVVDDQLGEIHHGDVDLVEPRRAVIERDLEHGLAEPVAQHRAVRQAAVARPQPSCGRERGQLVAAQVHPRLDGAVQLLPGGETSGRSANARSKFVGMTGLCDAARVLVHRASVRTTRSRVMTQAGITGAP